MSDDDFDDLNLSDLEAGAIHDVEKVEVEPAKKTRKPRTRRNASGKATALQKKRVPLHKRHTIQSDKKPGFIQRVVNDVEDRVRTFLDGGYEIVQDGRQIGDKKSGLSSEVGSASTRPVGGGIRGVLMEIPEELYNQDQLDKQVMVDETELATMPVDESGKPISKDELYGSVSIDRGAGSGRQSIDINISR